MDSRWGLKPWGSAVKMGSERVMITVREGTMIPLDESAMMLDPTCMYFREKTSTRSLSSLSVHLPLHFLVVYT
jgi:hypothetical protein